MKKNLFKNLFKRPVNKYVAYVSGTNLKRKLIYNTSASEMMLDAYWAFVFGNASGIKIGSIRKGRKVFRTFNSLEEWKEEWIKLFGPYANYFVLAERM